MKYREKIIRFLLDNCMLENDTSYSKDYRCSTPYKCTEEDYDSKEELCPLAAECESEFGASIALFPPKFAEKFKDEYPENFV